MASKSSRTMQKKKTFVSRKTPTLGWLQKIKFPCCGHPETQPFGEKVRFALKGHREHGPRTQKRGIFPNRKGVPCGFFFYTPAPSVPTGYSFPPPRFLPHPSRNLRFDSIFRVTRPQGCRMWGDIFRLMNIYVSIGRWWGKGRGGLSLR